MGDEAARGKHLEISYEQMKDLITRRGNNNHIGNYYLFISENPKTIWFVFICINQKTCI